MGNYLLGWDIGTSSLKTAILDSDGNHWGSVRKKIQLHHPFPGAAELDPDTLWSDLVSATGLLLQQSGIHPGSIVSLGVSTLCPGLVLFDTAKKPLYPPIIVLDSRSRDEADQLNRDFGEETFFSIGGNRVAAGGSTLPLLLWFRNHRPELYEAIDSIGYLPSWLGIKLTGELGLDYSGASYTGLFDTRSTRNWSSKLLDLTQIDADILPPLGYGSDRLGGLINEDLIAIGIRRNIPVAFGGADTACSALALGVFGDGEQFLTLGTSGVLCAGSNSSGFDDRCMNRCHITGNTWLMNGAMSNAGLAVSWLGSILQPERDPSSKKTHPKRGFVNSGNRAGSDSIFPETQSTVIFEELARSALPSSPGAGGLVFLPYLTGERTPVWDSEACGVLYGLRAESSRADIVRAVLESTGYSLRQVLALIEPLTGCIETLPVTGGGAVSDVWLQIIADITGKKLSPVLSRDTAAIGAALLGGIACSIYRNGHEAAAAFKKERGPAFFPDLSVHGCYLKNFDIYESLYPLLTFQMLRNDSV